LTVRSEDPLLDRNAAVMEYDFYASLLTERQRQIYEMYYLDDMSLGEVARAMGISRQAVFAILKRSRAKLRAVEEKLGLVSRWRTVSRRRRELLEGVLSAVESDPPDLDRARELIARLFAMEEV